MDKNLKLHFADKNNDPLCGMMLTNRNKWAVVKHAANVTCSRCKALAEKQENPCGNVDGYRAHGGCVKVSARRGGKSE